MSYVVGIDTPSQVHKSKGPHTNTKTSRKDNHHELCLEMDGKITIVKCRKFLEYFVPAPQETETGRKERKPTKGVFKGLPVPQDEKELYFELVSQS